MVGRMPNGQPFWGPRATLPMYPSVQSFALGKADHLRFMIRLDDGYQFLSPYVRWTEDHRLEEPMDLGTEGLAKITADTWIAERYLEIVSVLVVDFTNQCIGRPLNFSLPCRVSKRQTVKMTALVRKLYDGSRCQGSKAAWS